jgi:uncharacterized membrane protein YedE/YeeE
LENFTPVSALLGGLLIGAAATLMLWANGRIAGISGILGGVLFSASGDKLWRILFIGGLLGGGLIIVLVTGSAIDIQLQVSPLLTAVAGLLVGIGTRMGSGCTSGHGICGIARFSKRSFIATTIFIATGVITVFVVRHIIGVAS